MKINPLAIIAAIFACAFAGRMISVADAALNTATPSAQKKADNPAAEHILASKPELATQAPQPLQPIPAPTPKAINDADVSEKDRLISAIKERAAALDEKEAALEDRARYLEIIEVRVDEKLEALKKSNESLAELVAFADEAAKNDIDLLSRMYEQMKPQKAGEIFNKMDPSFAAGFLTHMNSENAALILTNMETDKAYQASMIIASRNAAVHRQ